MTALLRLGLSTFLFFFVSSGICYASCYLFVLFLGFVCIAVFEGLHFN